MITTVQTHKGQSGGYNNSWTLAIGTVTVGNFLVAVVYNGDGDPAPTITDNQGNHWSIAKSETQTGQRRCSVIYCNNAVAGSTTLTFSTATFNDAAAIVREYSGMPSADSLDQTSGSAGNASSFTTTSGTTVQNVELVVAGLAIDSQSAVITGDAGYSTLVTQNSSSAQFTQGGFQDNVTSTLGAQSITMTTNAPQNGSLALVTFGSTAITQPAIAKVQQAGSNSGASYVNSLTVTWSQNTTTGNYLSLAIVTSQPFSSATSRIASVVDSQGNTWTQQKYLNGASASVNVGVYYYDCVNCIGGPTPTITVTLTGGEFDTMGLIATEMSGIVTSSAIDGYAHNAGSGITTPGTVGSTAQNNEAAFIIFASSDSTALCSIANPWRTWNQPTAYTDATLQQNSTQFTMITQLDTLLASSGSVGPTFYNTIGAYSFAMIITLKGKSSAVPTPPVPSAPTYVAVSTSTNRAYLSWNAPVTSLVNGFYRASGITGFNVLRSTTSGSGYSTLASNLSAAFYDDTGVSNGTTYYYVVQAVNASGASVNSTQVTAVVATPTAHGDQWYAYGAKPTGVSQTTIAGYFNTHWTAWKSYLLNQTGATQAGWGAYRANLPAGTGGGLSFNNQTVSEAIGYGMIAAVYAANPTSRIYDIKAQSYLNGMLLYYDWYKDYQSWYFSSGNLMNWNILSDGTILSSSNCSATDGDEDVAFALCMGHRLFGSTGGVDYWDEARSLINSMRTPSASAADGIDFWPHTSAIAPPDLVNNGDAWGTGVNAVDPDFMRFAYYPIYAYHSGNATWTTQVHPTNWSFIATHFTSVYTTGLVPDGCKWNGLTGAGDGQAFSYGYNAIRMGWGYTLDYLYNGTTEAYNNQVLYSTYALSISGGTASNLGGLPKSLSSWSSGGTNETAAGGFGSASTVDSGNASALTFAGAVATYINTQAVPDASNYFGLSQGLMNLLLLSGEMVPDFGPIPPPPGGTTPTASFLLNFI